jgi:arylsulfatase A-like enzyme
MLDLLPTFAALTKAPLPKQPIDGHNIMPLLLGEADASSPTDERGFFYYHMDQLQAVRSGPWKLYLPLAAKRSNLAGKTMPSEQQLFNVRDDVVEAHEISASHPEVVQRLLKLAETARNEIGDNDSPGQGQRPAGHVTNPVGLLMN